MKERLLKNWKKLKLKPMDRTDEAPAGELESEITEHSKIIQDLERTLQEELEKMNRGTIQYRLKNREDTVTFLTLLFLTSCIIFLIFAENLWIYSSLVSRLLFSLGLIFLLIRVVYRAIDLPPGWSWRR